jgi:outer membrane murein-binding lipoprotein Lpp
MTLCAILLLTGCENKQVKNPVAAETQQIESPLQNTAEGMAKACNTKAPEPEPCRLRSRLPNEMALYLPHHYQSRFP